MIQRFKQLIHNIDRIHDTLRNLQNAVGRIELRQVREQTQKDFENAEFKVTSQWGEDGLIQFIIDRIPIERKIFVEFGVESYLESNTRFLLQNNNWSGLILDGSVENIHTVQRDPIYWRYNLKAVPAFVTKDNINALLQENGLEGDIGLLSVDIDGNDYWIWEAIEAVKPRIVVCEYNSLFGPNKLVTIPYSNNFARADSHWSCVYYGASISALTALAEKKGYRLIGSNRAGNNVFFVLNSLSSEIRTQTPAEAYVKSQFREMKDKGGQLLFGSHEEMIAVVKDLPVFDLASNKIVKLEDSAHAF